jgi:hypothetical protein
MRTSYKINCLVRPIYKSPLGFSWFVFYLLTLSLYQGTKLKKQRCATFRKRKILMNEKLFNSHSISSYFK